jgi:hypothetical protein
LIISSSQCKLPLRSFHRLERNQEGHQSHDNPFSIKAYEMEVDNLIPLLEQLDDNIDDLEEVLQPLLLHSLSNSSKKLPLLEKAKLHVLVTYTLESLLFCIPPSALFPGVASTNIEQLTCVFMASMPGSILCSKS